MAVALTLDLPANVDAAVALPAAEDSQGIFIEGRVVAAQRQASRWILNNDVRGRVTVEVR